MVMVPVTVTRRPASGGRPSLRCTRAPGGGRRGQPRLAASHIMLSSSQRLRMLRPTKAGPRSRGQGHGPHCGNEICREKGTPSRRAGGGAPHSLRNSKRSIPMMQLHLGRQALRNVKKKRKKSCLFNTGHVIHGWNEYAKCSAEPATKGITGRLGGADDHRLFHLSLKMVTLDLGMLFTLHVMF